MRSACVRSQTFGRLRVVGYWRRAVPRIDRGSVRQDLGRFVDHRQHHCSYVRPRPPLLRIDSPRVFQSRRNTLRWDAGHESADDKAKRSPRGVVLLGLVRVDSTALDPTTHPTAGCSLEPGGIVVARRTCPESMGQF